jgi:hypothetical protein
MKYSATTENSGKFSLRGVVPGRFTMTISSPGFPFKKVPAIQVTSDESRDLGTITLDLGCYEASLLCDDLGLGAPMIHAQVTVEVSAACGVDVDGGKMICSQPDSAADFGARFGENGEAYLVPGNGAGLALDTHGQWRLQDCMDARYSRAEVKVDNLPLGSRVCVQSNDGRYAELFGFARLVQSLKLTFITWHGKSDPH